MSDLQTLASRVSHNRSRLDQASGAARSALQVVKTLEQQIHELTGEAADLDRVAILLTSLGEEKQAQAQGTIESLVTQGLQTVFDETLSFHIVHTTKAKNTTVDFVVRTTVDGDVIETPILEARGGGLAAVVGFLLRVVVLALSTTKSRLLVLDESFSMVSEEYLPAVAQFLREVVDQSGVQIILVTHQEALTENADVVYRFSQQAGKTKAVRL